MALHGDPGEEPFCSPTDAPVAPSRKPPQSRRKNGERTNTATSRAGEGVAPDSPHDPRGRRRFPAHTTIPQTTPVGHKARTERTLQPRTGSSLRTSRPDRPGPRSQSFFRRYGSILPTSLTYIDAIDERLYTLETCCGWWVRTGSRAAKTGPGFSRAAESAPDAARAAALYRHLFRISGRADSTDMVLYEEERTLPGAPGDVSGLACVTAVSPAKRQTPPKQRSHPRALSESGFGNINPIPFRREAGRSYRSKDKTTTTVTDPAPFGKTFARVLGPTDPCSTAVGTEPFSTSVFEGLVRIFATTTEICTRGRLHPGSRPRLLCHRGALLLIAASVWHVQKHAPRRDGPASVRRSSAIHFRGRSIRQVSCYTLLSGFRLPWPPSCCLYRPTPFRGSHGRRVRHLSRTFGSSHSASSAYQKWPTWHSHST